MSPLHWSLAGLAILGGLGLAALWGGGEEPLQTRRATAAAPAKTEAQTRPERRNPRRGASRSVEGQEPNVHEPSVQEPVEEETPNRGRRRPTARDQVPGPATAPTADQTPAASPRHGTAETRILRERVGAAGRLEGVEAKAGESGGLRLDTTFERQGDALVVRYRVTNEGKQSIFLFNPLTRYDFTQQRWRLDHGRVYGRKLPGRTVEITKRMVMIPSGVNVFMPEVPALTELAAGAVLVETLRLPLPLELEDPYAPARKPRTGTATHKKRGPALASGVRLAIGYLSGVDRSELKPLGDHFAISYAAARKHQELLVSGRVALSFPVRTGGKGK